jgi:hypothetical protein
MNTTKSTNIICSESVTIKMDRALLNTDSLNTKGIDAYFRHEKNYMRLRKHFRLIAPIDNSETFFNWVLSHEDEELKTLVILLTLEK